MKTKSPLFGNYLVPLWLTSFVQKLLPNRRKSFFCDTLFCITFELWYSRPWYHCVSPLVCAYIPPPAPPAYILDCFLRRYWRWQTIKFIWIYPYFSWSLTAKDLKFRNTNTVALDYITLYHKSQEQGMAIKEGNIQRGFGVTRYFHPWTFELNTYDKYVHPSFWPA